MATEASADHPSRVLVSSARPPLSYLFICKRHLQEHGEVHLSALGVAISSLVSLVEILKARGLAVETKVATVLEVLPPDDNSDRARKKPKMEVVLVKAANFDEIMAKEAAEEVANKADAARGGEAVTAAAE